MDELTGRLAALLGAPPRSVRPLGGGTFGRPYAVVAADGRELFAKVAVDGPPGLLASEARSLRALTVPGGADVAAVVAADDTVLVTAFVATAAPTAAAAAALGGGLARTHRAGAAGYGAAERTYLASEVLPAGTEAPDWPTFYAQARLAPFLARAEAAGGIGRRDAADVRAVVAALPELAGPAEPVARLHGDLWSGNVLWTERSATLIDPAAHGGHRETDLAMLALFGLPHLDAVLAAYDREWPLSPGWRRRVPLHQIFPLLVHALLFGGSYGAAAGDAARRALRLVDRSAP